MHPSRRLAPPPSAALTAALLGATLLALTAPAVAEPARRVALVLDPAPDDDGARAAAVEAATLVLLGLAAPRDGSVEWAVLSPGEDAPSGQTLDAALGAITDWGARDGRGQAALDAGKRWAGGSGQVVHIGPAATGPLAVKTAGDTPPFEAIVAALQRVWRDEPGVRVAGPLRRLRAPAGVGQLALLATAPALEGFSGEPLMAGEAPPTRGWVEVAPPAGAQIEFKPSAIAVLTAVRVRIGECDLRGSELPRFTVWPAAVESSAIADALEFSLAGAEGALPPTVKATPDGRVALPDALVGPFTLTPRLQLADVSGRGPTSEVAVGPTVECQVRPAVVVTPAIGVADGPDGPQVQVSFVDAAGQPLPADAALAAGAIEVESSAGAAVPLTARGPIAVGALPERGSDESLRLWIEPESSRSRALGGASVTLPATAGGGVAPWWVGLLAAALVGLVGAAWPHASGWLVSRIRTGNDLVARVSVTIRGAPLNERRVDRNTVYPMLVTGLHPVPLGESGDAPSLLRLELRRGLRGIRLVALIAEGAVVRERSRPVGKTPWSLGDVTVDVRA